MKFIVLFLVLVCVILWFERAYWKRTAGLLESRLAGADGADSHSLVDTWLAGRSESRIRRKTGVKG